MTYNMTAFKIKLKICGVFKGNIEKYGLTDI